MGVRAQPIPAEGGMSRSEDDDTALRKEVSG
jgi:hypothetical protein